MEQQKLAVSKRGSPGAREYLLSISPSINEFIEFGRFAETSNLSAHLSMNSLNLMGLLKQVVLVNSESGNHFPVLTPSNQYPPLSHRNQSSSGKGENIQIFSIKFNKRWE